MGEHRIGLPEVAVKILNQLHLMTITYFGAMFRQFDTLLAYEQLVMELAILSNTAEGVDFGIES